MFNFVFGLFFGWMLFAEPTIKGGGVILMNSKDEVLLVQNFRTGIWGFPKGHYEKEDGYYYQTAIREMEEETTFQVDKDYILIPGSCRYGKRMYYFGKLIEDDNKERIPKINMKFPLEHLAINWFSKNTLPEKMNYDMISWIMDGKPNSCDNAGDKFEL